MSQYGKEILVLVENNIVSECELFFYEYKRL